MSFALPEGSVFAGHYRIVRCIAAGGMGAVYEVVHLETERRRALKVVLPHVLESADLRERFHREARVTAAIESAFLVDIFDVGVDEATQLPFLVMEMLRGEELGKKLSRAGKMSPSEVVLYLHQAALALDKTHAAGIVHRDLKPENLFLTHRDDGAPWIKILDFGIAKVIAQRKKVVNTGAIGSPLYMAPEQIRGEGTIGPPADIYALGQIAYGLLTGEPYWSEEAENADTIFALLSKITGGAPEPASARARLRRAVTLPAAFDAWFARVTALSPERRFERASNAIRLLAESLGVSVDGAATAPQPSAAAPISERRPVDVVVEEEASRPAMFSSVLGDTDRRDNPFRSSRLSLLAPLAVVLAGVSSFGFFAAYASSWDNRAEAAMVPETARRVKSADASLLPKDEPEPTVVQEDAPPPPLPAPEPPPKPAPKIIWKPTNGGSTLNGGSTINGSSTTGTKPLTRP